MSSDVSSPRPGQSSCSACGSCDVVHIIYGMLTPEGMGELDPWEVLGGCDISDDSPTRRCNQCGSKWAFLGELRRDTRGDEVEPAESRRRRNARPSIRAPRKPPRRGPLPRRTGPPRYSSPVGLLASVNSLLGFAQVQDIDELGDWVSDRSELDAFARLEDGELAVGFHTRAVRIEFPTTISEFWDSVTEVEDEILANLEAEYEAELAEDTDD